MALSRLLVAAHIRSVGGPSCAFGQGPAPLSLITSSIVPSITSQRFTAAIPARHVSPTRTQP